MPILFPATEDSEISVELAVKQENLLGSRSSASALPFRVDRLDDCDSTALSKNQMTSDQIGAWTTFWVELSSTLPLTCDSSSRYPLEPPTDLLRISQNCTSTFLFNQHFETQKNIFLALLLSRHKIN